MIWVQPFRRLPYICKQCETTLSRSSSQSFEHQSFITARRSYSNVTSSSRPFRMAVIGSGPAGFYAAYRLMNKVPNSIVDMYEMLPVPYGLVRFGVAPDHPEVKNCQDRFEEVGLDPRFNFIGNVEIGKDISLASLKPHYDAFLFSYGASKDKTLGIPGEEGKGVISARAFVGWYNGLPEYAGLNPALDIGEDAVIIGQGNVALDVARILLSPVDELRKTDITEYAVEALLKNRIKNVTVVGRRGPLQASFTIKEVRELMNIPGVHFRANDTRSNLPDPKPKIPRVQSRIFDVLVKGSPKTLEEAAKQFWELKYFSAPQEFELAPPDATDAGWIRSAKFSRTKYVDGADPLVPASKVQASDEPSIRIPASLAFRSVGYKSEPLPGFKEIGVPFDSRMGIIPNDQYGRIVNPAHGPGELTAAHVPGMYCTGWVKRGPTGVITSTMDDAFISADVIASDWDKSVQFLNHDSSDGSTGLGWEGVKAEAEKNGVRRVDWDGWKKIDAAERKVGETRGKEREKFGSVKEMLDVVSASTVLTS